MFFYKNMTQFLSIYFTITEIVPALQRGREHPDAISLRYADTSLQELLGRPSLRFAEMSMRNTSKCACVIQKIFLNLCFKFK